MKKLFLSLIAVAVGTLSSFAQDDLVATLSHGSALSTFTGADALSQAYTAAEEGDVITLSPGTFIGVNIEKAITLRGAGMTPSEENGYSAPTSITGEFSVFVPSGCTVAPKLEGLCCKNTVGFFSFDYDLAPVNIMKCYFTTVGCHNTAPHFTHCLFETELHAWCSGDDGYKNTFVRCDECVVKGVFVGDNYSKMCKIDCYNCIVWSNSIHDSTLENCIIADTYRFRSNNSVSNCVFFANLSDYVGINNNVFVDNGGETMFKSNLSSYFTPQTSFELTDEAATTYLGSDGSQVGIYGGSTPFDPTPTNPQVKKFTVNSTTEGDQLKVSINVE